ncbi:MAG: hypothetical protein IT330_05885 [Anaerolineae bacterium]|nr:hypothetical protein [Anaerolineae bacterium]
MSIEKDALSDCLVKKLHFMPAGGTNHQLYALYYPDGKVSTYLDRHRSKRDVDDKILKWIAKQMRVNMGQLKRLYSCTLTYEWYLEHLMNLD